jgi:formate-dependent nitrite reductase membrane component NrfD
MSWGAWILLAIYPASALFGLASLDASDLSRTAASGHVPAWVTRVLATVHARVVGRAGFLARVNVALGLLLGAYTRILLGTLAARAAYNSALLAPLFLISGVSTGAALMMLLPLSRAEHAVLRRWDVAAIGVEAVTIALYFIALSSTGSRGRHALELFFGGAYTIPFWTLVAFAGLFVPAVLEILGGRRGSLPTRLAPALVLGGGLSLRFIVVFAGQAA